MNAVGKETVKTELETQHEEHVRKGDNARRLMEEDLKKAYEDEAVETITYDLEKALPLP